MDLVTPDIGLIFWTTVSFGILYFVLAKFAWKPILGAVNEREKSIKDALSAAEKAKDEMENLKSDNEKILNEAKLQRELLLKEAREIKSKIISDAENEATEKANKLIEIAKTAIENEKSAAMKELKNTVVDLSLNIAEKLLSKELESKDKQLENIQEILDKTKLN
jgi:F-type H+-transporting ATPase subunit b